MQAYLQMQALLEERPITVRASEEGKEVDVEKFRAQ